LRDVEVLRVGELVSDALGNAAPDRFLFLLAGEV
jgi:hypothetical protein